MKILEVVNLMEARSNPELNKRKAISVHLKQKYGSRSDIFISFGEINKVGIHPSSSYNTPNGFYCYPLSYLTSLPYWSVRPFPMFPSPYCLVVELTDSTNVFDMSDNLPPSIIEKAKELGLLGPTARRSTMKGVWKAVYVELRKKYNIRANHTDDDSTNQEPSAVAREGLVYFRKMGIDGVTDIAGSGMIHKNEPVQAVFFNMRCLTHLESLSHESDENQNINVELIDSIRGMESLDEVTRIAHLYNSVMSNYRPEYDHKDFKKVLPDAENVTTSAKIKLGKAARTALLSQIFYLSDTPKEALNCIDTFLSIVRDGTDNDVWRHPVWNSISKKSPFVIKWKSEYTMQDIQNIPTTNTIANKIKDQIAEYMMEDQLPKPKPKPFNIDTDDPNDMPQDMIDMLKKIVGEKTFNKDLAEMKKKEYLAKQSQQTNKS